MSRRAVDAIFQALFLLTDIRAVLRKTAPLHSLDDAEKENVKMALEKIKKQLAILEEELI